MRKSYYDYLEKNNIETGEILGHKYWITESPMMKGGYGGYNGYIHFKKRPATERGYQGILTYVPVHGGITLARPDGKITFSILPLFMAKPYLGIIYGFDTGHCDSEKYPRADKAWVKKQIGLMQGGILRARTVEVPYLLTGYVSDFLGRFGFMRIFHKWARCIQARCVQFVWDTDKKHGNKFNFGMMINILCGKI
ncbi:hypothetical protein ES703_98771 [subsurface metagenome]